MVRYTLLRLMVFFGCLLFFWLVGLRRPDQQVFLLLASAGASVVLSYFMLRRQRDAFAERLASRVRQRVVARRPAHGVDEEAEDAELDQPAGPPDG